MQSFIQTVGRAARLGFPLGRAGLLRRGRLAHVVNRLVQAVQGFLELLRVGALEPALAELVHALLLGLLLGGHLALLLALLSLLPLLLALLALLTGLLPLLTLLAALLALLTLLAALLALLLALLARLGVAA